MNKDSRIVVTGHGGMVGSAVMRRLAHLGFTNVFGATRHQVDLTNQRDVDEYFALAKPEYVFHAAGKVGGIHANNTYPAQFIYDNLQMAANVVEASRRYGVKKLLFLGSVCIYPKHAAQPVSEDSLLTGPLEPTNEWYAIAKIAGIKLCQAYRKQYGCDFISAMPCNLYGPGDNYDPVNSHVLPGLIRRFHSAALSNAKEVVCWGTGTPLREFLHVDDLAAACVLLMEKYSADEPINIGSGNEVSIREASEFVAHAVGYSGKIVFDTAYPDGTPRRLMDSSKIKAMGWNPSVSLGFGLRRAYEDFLKQQGLD